MFRYKSRRSSSPALAFSIPLLNFLTRHHPLDPFSFMWGVGCGVREWEPRDCNAHPLLFFSSFPLCCFYINLSFFRLATTYPCFQRSPFFFRGKSPPPVPLLFLSFLTFPTQPNPLPLFPPSTKKHEKQIV